MNFDHLIEVLRNETQWFPDPLVDMINTEFGHHPFLMLIACLLSLRARDSTTIHICRDLFSRATTPAELLDMPRQELEHIIFKSGFYKTKARVIQEVSKILLDSYNGMVPVTFEELILLPGVGPKTANLVLGLAFGTPKICVDTHVHRISNRLGLITTKTPEETEHALEKKLPKNYWIEWNKLLVKWGQNICTPISPRCSTCAIRPWCKRIGVTKHR